MTSKYHITRARFILNNCTDGAQISMVAASSERISPVEWAYQYLYQTAGFAKALLQFRC
ncbi:hypothetical protein [Jatrophihabitans sp. GAS493]|uniref:hypothetical protein n=1 Tax=Jatrophihabitans sp. GAS493 TaxID=1907575 RepID=UPI0012FDF95E|nr:hypothetical protein [Jatrophihabitans sp. GAS493]